LGDVGVFGPHGNWAFDAILLGNLEVVAFLDMIFEPWSGSFAAV
jgi:hypothetical protein